MTKIILGVIAAAIVVIVVFMAIDPKMNANSIAPTTLVSSTNNFTVTVEGEVYKTGTYTLSEGALMSDLLEACGGPTESADLLAFYEDAELKSGSTYFIASKYDASNVCSLTEISKVNINRETAEIKELPAKDYFTILFHPETLTNVNGFTTSIANSIISYRSENGEFKTIEDLLEVYGIGNATYHKVRNYVTLHE